MESILDTIKKGLGIALDDTSFDVDIILHINTVMMNLDQIGVSPIEPVIVTGSDEIWSQLLGDSKKLEAVKTYILLKVRLIFDTPTSSFVIDSYERTLKELEVRINMVADPAPPLPIPVPPEEV